MVQRNSPKVLAYYALPVLDELPEGAVLMERAWVCHQIKGSSYRSKCWQIKRLPPENRVPICKRHIQSRMKPLGRIYLLRDGTLARYKP